MSSSLPMNNAQIAAHLADNLIRGARFWIGTGMSAEDALARALTSSAAGPNPIRLAREALGLS